MTRLPRSKRPGRELQTLAPPLQRFLPGGIIELRPIRHLRCPCCGLVARLERHVSEKTGEVFGIEGGPYPTFAAVQQFGGSPAAGSPGVNRAGVEYNRGRIEWTKDIPCSREELETLRTALQNALESVTEQIGRNT